MHRSITILGDLIHPSIVENAMEIVLLHQKPMYSYYGAVEARVETFVHALKEL